MNDMPAYNPKFFRVAEPKDPRLPSDDIYHLLPFNQKQMYNFDEILARLKQPVIIDGRNLYNPAQLQELGVEYYGIGRGASLRV